MNKYLHLFSFLILCGFTSCNNQKKELAPNLHIEQSFLFSDSFNVIYLSNNNNQTVSFELEINDFFPLKMTDIVQAVEDSSTYKNTSIEEEAWRYVARSSFWANPFTSENWQHDPILFLNSIGGGFCDDQASVLAAIWKNWFDSVRVVVMNRHVVPEVFNGEKWKMYDPDLMVAYLNDNNEICSVSELEDSPQFISSPLKDRVIGNNPIFKTNNPLSVRLSQIYTIKNEHVNETDWHLDTKKSSSRFTLPPFSSLKIEINQITQQVNISISLSEKSSGTLQIPFVPYDAKGSFEYIFENKSTWVNDSSHYFSTNKWVNSIDVKKVKSASEIRYLVNPKLKFFQPENSIKIKSSLPIEISKKQEAVSSYLPFELSSGLFFNEETAKYLDFLASLSNFSGQIDEAFMKKEYDLFLNLDEELTKEQKNILRKQFKKDWNDLKFDQKGKEFAILEDLYPQSAFYFFIASKNRKIDFVKSLLLEHL